MGQTRAEREAAIREIKARICAEYASDGVRADEVVLKSNGDIVIDRTARMPRTTPMVVGSWS